MRDHAMLLIEGLCNPQQKSQSAHRSWLTVPDDHGADHTWIETMNLIIRFSADYRCNLCSHVSTVVILDGTCYSHAGRPISLHTCWWWEDNSKLRRNPCFHIYLGGNACPQ